MSEAGEYRLAERQQISSLRHMMYEDYGPDSDNGVSRALGRVCSHSLKRLVEITAGSAEGAHWRALESAIRALNVATYFSQQQNTAIEGLIEAIDDLRRELDDTKTKLRLAETAARRAKKGAVK